MINLSIWRYSQTISRNESARAEITAIITEYFLFKNIALNQENCTVIVQAIYDYCRTKQKFRVCDLKRAIEIYRVNEDNNISAAHILGMCERYIQSDERKNFMKNLDKEKPKEEKESIKFNDESILKYAEENLSWIEESFKKTGQVYFSMSDKQFELLTESGYFNFIKQDKQQLNELAINELLSELDLSIYKLDLREAMEVKNKITEIKFGKLTDDEIKLLRRKYILKQYFKQKNTKK